MTKWNNYVDLFPPPVDVRPTRCCSVISCMLGVSPESGCCLGSRSGGSLHIFVSCYRSELSGGWVPSPTESSVLTWPAYLLHPERGCDSSPGWLCCFLFFPHRCIGSGQSCRASALCFCETRCCCVVGLHWHCFLPISDFNCSWSRLWRLIVPQVSFFKQRQEIAKLLTFCFPTYHLFTRNPAA